MTQTHDTYVVDTIIVDCYVYILLYKLVLAGNVMLLKLDCCKANMFSAYMSRSVWSLVK